MTVIQLWDLWLVNKSIYSHIISRPAHARS